MSQRSVDMSAEAPQCPKCDRPMVRRTARKGTNAGSEFWGCPEFPRCRGTLPYEASADAPTDAGPAEAVAADDAQVTPERPTDSDSGDKPEGLLTKVARKVDKGWRWYLETDEPDASGRWDDAHRRRMLTYIYDRDGGRCGLCAAEMKKKGAHIEHIVPKVFVYFDVRNGKAEDGTRFKSRLHKLDNLQAAHTYCNKRKGNTSQVSKWRHPKMPQLTVADADDGQEFVLPWNPS